MIKHHRLEHRFVQNIPETLDDGVLYVSIEYATAVHRCCCGCGAEVVTPFSPTDWNMTFNGDTVSLSPSVGNWRLPCRSHYIVRHGKVLEAGLWDDERIEAAIESDHRAKAAYYGMPPVPQPAPPTPDVNAGVWARLRRWLHV